MELRFWTDPESGLPHIYNHGVTEEEVNYVLRWPGLDYSEGRNARAHLGQTAAGRYLKVVYVPDKVTDSVFVVTAYELRGNALRAYRRAQRRKRR